MFYSNFTHREQAPPYETADDGTIIYTRSEEEAWLDQHPNGSVDLSEGTSREEEIESEMISSIANELMDLFNEIHAAIKEDKLTLQEAKAAMENIAIDELFESHLEDFAD